MIRPAALTVMRPSRRPSRPTSGLLVTYMPPYSPNSLMPDNGLAALAAVLQQAGHRAQVLDYCTTATLRRLVTPFYRERLGNIWQDVQTSLSQGKPPRKRDIAELLFINWRLAVRQNRDARRTAAEIAQTAWEREADWVGFKLWNGPGFTIPVMIARELKRLNPKLQIAAGGPQVDYFMKNIYAVDPPFDFLVYAEGEEALLRQVERIGGSGEGIGEIPNTIYRSGGEVKKTPLNRVLALDELPFPAYDPESYPAMARKKVLFPVVEESRGCDNFCNFCGHSVKSGGKIFSRSPQRVVDSMDALRRAFGATHFRFGGSSTPGALLRGIAQEILRRERKYQFTAFARVRDAVTADYPLLKRAGYAGQFFGIESADQRILDGMNKGYQVGEAERVVQASVAAGFYTVLSFIYPAPGEDAESRSRTLDFIRRTNPQAAIVTPPLVVPRTPWASKPANFGIELSPGYVAEIMTYPIRHLLPPALWPVAPWKIGGRNSRELMNETGEFGKAIESLGVPTGISDDIAFMARLAGMEPVPFRDQTREYFFTGDADALDALVGRINRGVVDY